MEIERYGRMWIWEGYFDPKQRDLWMQAAEKLRNINIHVREDIQDYILIKGFQKKNIKDKQKAIENFNNELRQKQKNKKENSEEEDKVEDKKRSFLYQMRPPFYWNFFEDGERKTEHLLRHDANPQSCYIDGRVESFLEDMERLGFHLTRYQEENWKILREYTLSIFKD